MVADKGLSETILRSVELFHIPADRAVHFLAIDTEGKEFFVGDVSKAGLAKLNGYIAEHGASKLSHTFFSRAGFESFAKTHTHLKKYMLDWELIYSNRNSEASVPT